MINNVIQLKQIVREHQYQKINGMIVDATSANAVLQVRNALKPVNRKKYDWIINTNIAKAVDIAWALLAKQGG